MTPEEAAALLGVDLPADRATIEAAFRRTAKRTHPDRFAGDTQANVLSAAREFDEAAQARETLLRMPPAPTPARSQPPPEPTKLATASQPRRNKRERAVIIAAGVALFLTIGAVLTVGLFPESDAVTTGAASSFSDPTKNPLHGLNVIPISDPSTIGRQCGEEADGKVACWLWSVASTRSCPHGIVTIDFFGATGTTVPTETITQDVGLRAHTPAFVSASREGFPEPRARISRFACNS